MWRALVIGLLLLALAGQAGAQSRWRRVPVSDAERQAAYTYMCASSRVEAIRNEVEAAQSAGLPASFTTDTQLPFPVLGAVRVEDQAQFDPYRYCVQLGRAFVDLGGQIYEQAMPLADRLKLTRVLAEFEADTFFPPIDPAEWRVAAEMDFPASERDSHATRYTVYERRSGMHRRSSAGEGRHG